MIGIVLDPSKAGPFKGLDLQRLDHSKAGPSKAWAFNGLDLLHEKLNHKHRTITALAQ
jgi:hypothetical protein